MKTYRRIIYLAALLAAFFCASCQKDDTLYYNNLTMGNMVDGHIVSDKGNIFNIVEQTCPGVLDTMKRVIVRCDVLKNTDGRSNEYDVRVTGFTAVLDKSPIPIEEASGEEVNVQDPIHIEHAWYSGGYLNMLLRFPVYPEIQKKHLINLVYEKETSGRYMLNLRHNSFGEKLNESDSTAMVLAAGYVSFPLSHVITEDQAELTLKWNWYESAENGWIFSEEKEYKEKHIWMRPSYEQVPQKARLTF